MPRGEEMPEDHENTGRQKAMICVMILGNLLLLGLGVLLFVVGGLLTSVLNGYSNLLTEILFVQFRTACTVCYAIGGLTCAVAIVGILCVFLSYRMTVGVYLGLLALLAASCALLSIGYNATSSSWYVGMQMNMWINLKDYFYDINATFTPSTDSDQYAYLWNQLSYNYSCCGVYSFVDYQSATNWARQTVLTSSNYSDLQEIPYWCCVMSNSANFPQTSFSDTNCPYEPTTSNSYISTLCPAVIMNSVSSSTWQTILTITSVVVPAYATLLLVVVLGSIRFEMCDYQDKFGAWSPRLWHCCECGGDDEDSEDHEQIVRSHTPRDRAGSEGLRTPRNGAPQRSWAPSQNIRIQQSEV